jgi:UDP-N-acetylmuramoyl-tripeptide--D-alanyl-D-alanine ligase
MTMQFNWQQLIEITGGSAASQNGPTIAAISTDTRTLQQGDLYLALRGDRFDGHDFIDAAIESGASALCVESSVSATIPTLIVPDTLAAYQQIATSLRLQFDDLQVVAVTGSSGKTSTKEMIASVLRARYPDAVFGTQGNTNNHIGVPQNLLRLCSQHKAAVLELGTSGPGEISNLTELVQPDIAVLTNVGPVHLEGLGSIEGVACEKACIFSTLAATGHAVLPASLRHDPNIAPALPSDRTVTIGAVDSGADIEAEQVRGDLRSSQIRIHRTGKEALTFTWQLTGLHQALNAAVAFAVAGILKIDDETIVAGLKACTLPGMRMQTFEHESVTWINDAYNANPDSMRCLVDWLATIDPGADNTVHLVLGDMLELGENSLQLHTEFLRHTRRALPRANLVPFGDEMSAAATALGISAHTDINALRENLDTAIKAGDIVAVKASRGIALERVLPEGENGGMKE